MANFFRQESIEYQHSKLLGDVVLRKPRTVSMGIAFFFAVFTLCAAVLGAIRRDAPIAAGKGVAMVDGVIIAPQEALEAAQSCQGVIVFQSSDGTEGRLLPGDLQPMEERMRRDGPDSAGGGVSTAHAPVVTIACRQRLFADLLRALFDSS